MCNKTMETWYDFSWIPAENIIFRSLFSRILHQPHKFGLAKYWSDISTQLAKIKVLLGDLFVTVKT